MDGIAEIARQMALARAAARPFDRIVVQDQEILAGLPHRGWEDVGELERIAGLPVYTDAALEPGTIELRDGDKVIHRITGVE